MLFSDANGPDPSGRCGSLARILPSQACRYEVLTGCGPALKPGARGITKGPAGPRTPERAGRRNECCACPLMAGRDGPPYFLVVGFLAVDEGWQHEPPAGLAELALGLLAVISGLLPVVAGLGVPFHGSIAFS